MLFSKAISSLVRFLKGCLWVEAQVINEKDVPRYTDFDIFFLQRRLYKRLHTLERIVQLMAVGGALMGLVVILSLLSQ